MFLNAPTFLFVLFYAFIVPSDLDGFITVRLMESLALPGLVGASLTFAAFILTLAATLRGDVSRKAERMLWALMALAFGGWLYIWISFSILFHMPLMVPLLAL